MMTIAMTIVQGRCFTASTEKTVLIPELLVEMGVRTHIITTLHVVIKPDYQIWAAAETAWMLN